MIIPQFFNPISKMFFNFLLQLNMAKRRLGFLALWISINQSVHAETITWDDEQPRTQSPDQLTEIWMPFGCPLFIPVT